MAKFEAKIYVLQSEWEKRWVTIEANSEEEAKEKIEDHDYDIIDEEMGDVHERNIEIEIDYLKSDKDIPQIKKRLEELEK